MALSRKAGPDGGERVGSSRKFGQSEVALRAGDREIRRGNDVDISVHPRAAWRSNWDEKFRMREGVDFAWPTGFDGEIQGGIPGDMRRNAEMGGVWVAGGKVHRLAGHDAKQLRVEAALKLSEHNLRRCGFEISVLDVAGYPEKHRRLGAVEHMILPQVPAAPLQIGAFIILFHVGGSRLRQGAGKPDGAFDGTQRLRCRQRPGAAASCRERQDAGKS